MIPIFYRDARSSGKRSAPSFKRGRASHIPGLDYDFYPEINPGVEMENFGDLQGMFEIPLPWGFPYFDFQVVALNGKPKVDVSFTLVNDDEYFILESIKASYPNAGAGAYPDFVGTGNEPKIPLIQLAGSDPNRRRGTFATGGPEYFSKPIPINQVGGPGNSSNGGKIDFRRTIFFSPKDTIKIEIRNFPALSEPTWVALSIAGRMVSKSFLQGVIT